MTSRREVWEGGVWMDTAKLCLELLTLFGAVALMKPSST